MIDIVDNYLPEKDFFELFNSMKEFSFDWHLSHILTKDAEKRGPGLYFSMPPIYIYVLGSLIGFIIKIVS